MRIQIVPVTERPHIMFIAKRFEETISLWKDYEVTLESASKRVAQLTEWIKDATVHVTVAVTPENLAVGFNSLYVAKDYSGNPFGKIVIPYVSPEFRRQGVAAALKGEGETWLVSQGVTRVVAEIVAKNTRMLEINKKAGFRIKRFTMERKLEGTGLP